MLDLVDVLEVVAGELAFAAAILLTLAFFLRSGGRALWTLAIILAVSALAIAATKRRKKP